MPKFSNEEEYKSAQLKEKTPEGLNKVLKEEAKEGWQIRPSVGCGFLGLGISQEYAIKYGLISLVRFKDWKARKEEKERAEKEAAIPMPPLTNKKVAELREKLREIADKEKALEQEKRKIAGELECISRECSHDWKITRTEMSFVFTEKTCKKCGEKTLE